LTITFFSDKIAVEIEKNTMKIMKKYEDPDKKLLKEQSKNTMN